MPTIWDPNIVLKYAGGRSLTFAAPDAEQTAWAVEFLENIKRESTPEVLNEALFDELPKKLCAWVVDGTIDGEPLPADWKEQLLQSSMLSGHTGLGTLQQLTFRDDLVSGPNGQA